MNLRPVVTLLLLVLTAQVRAETRWPRWRGPGGNGVAMDARLPLRWDRRNHIAWSAPVPGEGASSPVVWRERVFVTSAEDEGLRRSVHCLDARTGALLWTRAVEHDDPELSSSVTGHAASTPATDGSSVVAFFGNAGAVCYSAGGELRWRRSFGAFESEFGIASSPVIEGGRVILLCDHDGDRFQSFDSFLVALDVESGDVVWKTDRPGVLRSWSTPVVVDAGGRAELAVAAHGELRGYDLASGELLWSIGGLMEWVAPSPVFDGGTLFVTCGKAGPVLAARAGGSEDVTESRVVWKVERAGAYVVSPLVYRGRLYVLREDGVLACYRAATGERLFRERLDGNFKGSPIAGAGRVYFPAEDGSTWVLEASDRFQVAARNRLEEYSVASPAAAAGRLYIRTERHLYCVAEEDGADRERPTARAGISAEERAAAYLAREATRWPRENGCFSCHHSGDATRALFVLKKAGAHVPEDAWNGARGWLLAPERWEKEGDADYGSPELARLQFAAALAAGLDAGILDGRSALERAAARIAADQHPEGWWPGGSQASIGSPTAYSRHLATLMALGVLRAAGSETHAARVDRALGWLRGRAPRNVHESAALLLAAAEAEERLDEAQRAACFEWIEKGRAPGGGWGAYANSPPQAFDTALVLLALARWNATEPQGTSPELERWIESGRAYLLRSQEEEGSWPETTRPPGAESYAQRGSTTAWAALALLATR